MVIYEHVFLDSVRIRESNQLLMIGEHDHALYVYPVELHIQLELVCMCEPESMTMLTRVGERDHTHEA